VSLTIAEPGWREALAETLESPETARLAAELERRRQGGELIYPPPELTFAALELCPLEHVKVVICGQDPYHGPGQAMGLAFSVPPGVAPPPSLRNIFRELRDDVGVPEPSSGDLSPWARRGVLLLNSSLSVAAGAAGSHSSLGWGPLTDAVIDAACAAHSDLVFLLWGKHAQRKGERVDRSRHHVLEAAHPSPLSAHSGFFGCRHFSRANTLLERVGKEPVQWRLP
jgi:uracil-DNA glycosylase